MLFKRDSYSKYTQQKKCPGTFDYNRLWTLIWDVFGFNSHRFSHGALNKFEQSTSEKWSKNISAITYEKDNKYHVRKVLWIFESVIWRRDMIRSFTDTQGSCEHSLRLYHADYDWSHKSQTANSTDLLSVIHFVTNTQYCFYFTFEQKKMEQKMKMNINNIKSQFFESLCILKAMKTRINNAKKKIIITNSDKDIAMADDDS